MKPFYAIARKVQNSRLSFVINSILVKNAVTKFATEAKYKNFSINSLTRNLNIKLNKIMNWISFITQKLKIIPKISSEESNQFLVEIKSVIYQLETSTEYSKDLALKRIVEILKSINTKSDLRRQKDLINRIAIDSVENWESIKKIGEFIKYNSK